MSAQNGERARFQRNRKRKVVQRQRLHAVMAEIVKRKAAAAETLAASMAMRDEGGAARIGK
jgi:hypothetical protein